MTWEEIARRINAEYLTVTDLKREFGFFNLWDWGTGRYSKILGGVRITTRDMEVIIGDFEYEHTRNATMPGYPGMLRGITFCLVKSPNLELPPLSVRSETHMHNLVKRVPGSYSITFAESPEFTESFEVQGPELPAHQLFTENIRNLFLKKFQSTNVRMEMRDNMMLFHYGVMIAPESTRRMIIDAVDLAVNLGGKPIAYEVPSYEM